MAGNDWKAAVRAELKKQKKREPKPGNKRFRFVQSENADWYCIPAELKREFKAWDEAGEEGPIDFCAYYLSHPVNQYSFERLLRDHD